MVLTLIAGGVEIRVLLGHVRRCVLPAFDHHERGWNRTMTFNRAPTMDY